MTVVVYPATWGLRVEIIPSEANLCPNAARQFQTFYGRLKELQAKYLVRSTAPDNWSTLNGHWPQIAEIVEFSEVCILSLRRRPCFWGNSRAENRGYAKDKRQPRTRDRRHTGFPIFLSRLT